MKKNLFSFHQKVQHHQEMNVSHYPSRIIELHVYELRFLFEYYPEVHPVDIIDSHVTECMYPVQDQW